MENTLKEKLTSVQSELKVGKNRYNEFNKFNYRSASDLEEAIKPLLVKYGLSLYISNDVVEVGGRVYVKSIATLSDGTDTIVTTAFAREDEVRVGMSESQTTGCAASYATKYNLANMFLVDDTDDADAFSNRREQPINPSRKLQNKPVQTQQAPQTTNTSSPLPIDVLRGFCKQRMAMEPDWKADIKKFGQFYADKLNKGWNGKFDVERLYSSWSAKRYGNFAEIQGAN